MGADDDVDPRRPALDRALILLRQASRDDDPELRVPILERFQMSQVAVQLVVGVLADRAGVQDDHPRVAGVLGRRHPVGHQDPADPLGVVLVHLAPEGADQEARLHALRVAEG
jgi:hypothetical protein